MDVWRDVFCLSLAGINVCSLVMSPMATILCTSFCFQLPQLIVCWTSLLEFSFSPRSFLNRYDLPVYSRCPPRAKEYCLGPPVQQGLCGGSFRSRFGAEWVFSKLPNPAELQENGIAVPVCLSLVRFSEVPGRNAHYKANCVREAI